MKDALLEEIQNRLANEPKVKNNFNIFSILGIARKEVPTSTLIAALLDPISNPYGNEFLRLFFKKVLHLDPGDLSHASVESEYRIENDRRIDIFIETPKYQIPIEVKLDAGDQKEQCADYLKYRKNANLYYLTLDMHEPSDYSLFGEEYNEKEKAEKRRKKAEKRNEKMENIRCISFGDHIYPWLIECSKLCENYPELKILLRQFSDVIKERTKKHQEDMERRKNMAKDILKTADRFEAAQELTEVLKQAKIEKMKEVFSYLENHLKLKFPHLQIENCTEDAEKSDLIEKYYNQASTSWPSINVILPTPKEYRLCFRVEIDWYLYCALCDWNPDKKGNSRINKYSDQSKYVKDNELILSGKKSNYCYWWHYLPKAKSATNEEWPNFRECTGLYSKLYDKEQFEIIMNNICSCMDASLEQLLNKISK